MQQTEELRAFFDRASKYIPEMFNIAHAASGSFDIAEYAVQCALSEVWLHNPHMVLGFREELRNAALSSALKSGTQGTEMTWELEYSGDEDPVSRCLMQESTDVRRMAVLRYGCGMSHGQIAKQMGASDGNVRDVLSRLERRLSHSVNDAHRPENMLAEWMRKTLTMPDRTMPGLNVMYRSFESEMTEYVRTNVKKHHFSRLVRWLAYVVLAAVCMAVFWLATVLMQSTEPETSEPGAPISEQAGEGADALPDEGA